MCRIILMVILGWGVLFITGITLAARFGPWWSIPLFVVLYLMATASFAKWGIRRLLLLPFRLKGAVLRGATVQVHEVQRTDPPAEEPTEPPTPDAPMLAGDTSSEEQPAPVTRKAPAGKKREDNRNLEFFWLDVTIDPKPRSGGHFSLWEPSELAILPHDVNTARLGAADEGESVREVRLHEGGVWRPDDPGKYEGPQRVRLLIAVPPAFSRRIKFRYYLEGFGNMLLPESPR